MARATKKRRDIRDIREREKYDEYALLIKAAIESGLTTLSAIHKVTEIPHYHIKRVINRDDELKAMYFVRKKLMVDKAVDNIQEIVDNPNHPQNFAASKYLIDHYETDMSKILTPKDSELNLNDISLNSDGVAPVVISFGKKE